MFVSYMVRLRSVDLAHGHFLGEVEGVATGRRYAVSSLEQLAAFMVQARGSELAASRTPAAELGDPADRWFAFPGPAEIS
jgi:hypothetical protein